MQGGISTRATQRLTGQEKDGIMDILGRIEKATSRPYSYGQAMPRAVETPINPSKRVEIEMIAERRSKERLAMSANSKMVVNGFPREFFEYFTVEEQGNSSKGNVVRLAS